MQQDSGAKDVREWSELGLLNAARDRHQLHGCGSTKRSFADVAVADAMHLPLRPNSVNAALCIAVLHHISTIDRRLQILNEIARILLPGGRALITVWAQEQEDTEKTIAKWQPIQHQDNPNCRFRFSINPTSPCRAIQMSKR